jgi:hypothetical protein
VRTCQIGWTISSLDENKRQRKGILLQTRQAQ